MFTIKGKWVINEWVVYVFFGRFWFVFNGVKQIHGDYQ